MDKPGFALVALPGKRRAIIETAQELDRRGFANIYCPSYADGLSLCLAIAMSTERIEIASGIAVIYTRHASEMAATAGFVNEMAGGRFKLGLGVAHEPGLRKMGIRPGGPVSDMRAYVEQLKAAGQDPSFPPVLLATLRRKMTALAGEVADGALWANAALSHMPASLAAIPAERREAFIVGNLAPCSVSDDRGAALAAIQRALRLYMTLPNYQNYFSEAGYGEEVERARAALAADDKQALADSVSERMAEDIGLLGTASQVREKVEAWHAAGVEAPDAVRLFRHRRPGARGRRGRGHLRLRASIAGFDWASTECAG